ncbi:hypothetical protein DFH07DRAFT_979525 [Mycena maculata]|uniref:Uncharacterized protein n=1 Tax=Mycena maculata TaxID=230809 RepID=A0AAD7N3B3_9AGAR|nr:hypothetical protein DFH07DRAFT_979525 [Mycena maculata]
MISRSKRAAIDSDEFAVTTLVSRPAAQRLASARGARQGCTLLGVRIDVRGGEDLQERRPEAIHALHVGVADRPDVKDAFERVRPAGGELNEGGVFAALSSVGRGAQRCREREVLLTISAYHTIEKRSQERKLPGHRAELGRDASTERLDKFAVPICADETLADEHLESLGLRASHAASISHVRSAMREIALTGCGFGVSGVARVRFVNRVVGSFLEKHPLFFVGAERDPQWAVSVVTPICMQVVNRRGLGSRPGINYGLRFDLGHSPSLPEDGRSQGHLDTNVAAALGAVWNAQIVRHKGNEVPTCSHRREESKIKSACESVQEESIQWTLAATSTVIPNWRTYGLWIGPDCRSELRLAQPRVRADRAGKGDRARAAHVPPPRSDYCGHSHRRREDAGFFEGGGDDGDGGVDGERLRRVPTLGSRAKHRMSVSASRAGWYHEFPASTMRTPRGRCRWPRGWRGAHGASRDVKQSFVKVLPADDEEAVAGGGGDLGVARTREKGVGMERRERHEGGSQCREAMSKKRTSLRTQSSSGLGEPASFDMPPKTISWLFPAHTLHWLSEKILAKGHTEAHRNTLSVIFELCGLARQGRGRFESGAMLWRMSYLERRAKSTTPLAEDGGEYGMGISTISPPADRMPADRRGAHRRNGISTTSTQLPTAYTSVYKRDGWGLIYLHMRVPWVILLLYLTGNLDIIQFLLFVELKAGHSASFPAWRRAYYKCERGIAILWHCAFFAEHRILAEQMTHRTLRVMGVEQLIYRCPGCDVEHCEYYPFLQVGGFAGLDRVVQAAIGATGQTRVEKIIFNKSGRLWACLREFVKPRTIFPWANASIEIILPGLNRPQGRRGEVGSGDELKGGVGQNAILIKPIPRHRKETHHDRYGWWKLEMQGPVGGHLRKDTSLLLPIWHLGKDLFQLLLDELSTWSGQWKYLNVLCLELLQLAVLSVMAVGDNDCRMPDDPNRFGFQIPVHGTFVNRVGRHSLELGPYHVSLTSMLVLTRYLPPRPNFDVGRLEILIGSYGGFAFDAKLSYSVSQLVSHRICSPGTAEIILHVEILQQL